ncbi:uncharacterized protein LOC136089297 [Hydra vulgaris]|uniref:Uncharacterized protein LOC136089297 n=1 Tax=Hydra vulgaris TaxID=6087 RepID=A0ABM4DAC0_HYDVU
MREPFIKMQQAPPASTIPMPPTSWQNSLEDGGYMSDDQVGSPVHNNSWIRAVDTHPKQVNTSSVAPSWSMWNPVPFPIWQFHLSANNTPEHYMTSFCISPNEHPRCSQRTSPIFIKDSPSSPLSVITISSTSESEENMSFSCDMHLSKRNEGRFNHYDVGKAWQFVPYNSRKCVAETPSPVPSRNLRELPVLHNLRSPQSTFTERNTHLLGSAFMDLRYLHPTAEQVVCKQEPVSQGFDSHQEFVTSLPSLVPSLNSFSPVAIVPSLTSSTKHMYPSCYISPVSNALRQQTMNVPSNHSVSSAYHADLCSGRSEYVGMHIGNTLSNQHVSCNHCCMSRIPSPCSQSYGTSLHRPAFQTVSQSELSCPTYSYFGR